MERLYFLHGIITSNFQINYFFQFFLKSKFVLLFYFFDFCGWLHNHFSIENVNEKTKHFKRKWTFISTCRLQTNDKTSKFINKYQMTCVFLLKEIKSCVRTSQFIFIYFFFFSYSFDSIYTLIFIYDSTRENYNFNLI